MAIPTSDPRYQGYSTNDGSFRVNREEGWQKWDGQHWQRIANSAVPKGLQGSVTPSAPAVYSPSTYNSAAIPRSERPRSAQEMLREQQAAARNSMGSQVNPDTPMRNRMWQSGSPESMGYSPSHVTGYVANRSSDPYGSVADISSDPYGNTFMNTIEGQTNFGPMQVQQQAAARQAQIDQRNAAGRANVLQRFANGNQRLTAMGATANMPRINDVGYGGSARGALPPNISGQGGINNTALMGPNAKPTFRYGVSQSVSMPYGSSPGAVGYGGAASMPTMQHFGGSQPPRQMGGVAPPGMYTQGHGAGQQGMGPGGAMTPPGMMQPGGWYPGAMAGKPDMLRFGTPRPRQMGPQNISPYVR